MKIGNLGKFDDVTEIQQEFKVYTEEAMCSFKISG